MSSKTDGYVLSANHAKVELSKLSVELLEKIRSVWLSTRSKFRDGMVEVGQHILAYIRQRLEDGNALNDRERRFKGISREKITLEVARALETHRNKVNELVRIAVVVELLTDGNLGNLSYSSLRTMKALVCRVNRGKAVKRHKIRHNEGWTPQEEVEFKDTEVWGIKPQFKEVDVKRLVKEAIENNHGVIWVEKEIQKLQRSVITNNVKRNAGMRVKPSIQSVISNDTDSNDIDDVCDKTRFDIPRNDDGILEQVVTLLLASNDPVTLLSSLQEKIKQQLRLKEVALKQLNEREERIRQYQLCAEVKKPLKA